MWISWIGNLLIFLGLWRLGSKKRDAFFFSIVGEGIWIYCAAAQEMWSLTFLCSVLLLVAVRGLWEWNRKNPKYKFSN